MRKTETAISSGARAADRHHFIESAGVEVHIAEWLASAPARHTLLLVPGTGSHARCYARFMAILSELRVHCFAVDLKGHGLSGGPRGVFTMRELCANVGDAAAFIAAQRGQRVAVLGTSQGGEVALHALLARDEVSAAICHNVLLPTLWPLNVRMRLMQSAAAGALSALAPWLPVPLRLAFDWQRVYLDEETLAARLGDRLALTHYSLAAYRSIFTTPPPYPPAGNCKPVLVACGERDEIVPVAHCVRCYCALGGPKELYVMPGAAHQLVVDYADGFAPVVAAFLERALGNSA